MVPKTLLTMMLVAALAAAPTALADPVPGDDPNRLYEETQKTVDEAATEAGQEADRLLGEAGEAADDATGAAGEAADQARRAAEGVQETADGAVDDVAALLECRTAVLLTLEVWGGTVTDERDRSAEFLDAVDVTTESFTRTVPVYETVEETLWQAGGLLGALEPITREVQRLVGHEEITYATELPIDFAVSLDWHEEYIEWDHLTADVHVTLPAAISAGVLDDGQTQMVCDPEAVVHNVVPTFRPGDYDIYSVLEPTDGWYWELLSLDVRLATTEDYEELPWRTSSGTSICPAALLARAHAEAEASGATGDDALAQQAAREAAGLEDQLEPERSEFEPTPHSTGGTTVGFHVPAGTLATLAVLFGLVISAVWFVSRYGPGRRNKDEQE